MKLSSADLPLMRKSMLALGTSILISTAVLYTSGIYATKTQHDLRSAQRMLGDARNRLASAQEDQKNMAIYADEYGTLMERKIIGEDQRLDWMEGMERLRLRHLVTDFSYTISPQTTYAPQPAIDSGNFDIRYSAMKLQLDLLHEGQLVNFFDALRSQIKGYYHLGGCTLQRTASTNSPAATLAQLKAECNGGWITLNNRNN